MDSIIHSIQEGVNQLFGIQSQTSAPIIISLSIFIIGLAFAEISKGIGRVRKRKTTRKIFFQIIDVLISQISDQSEAYLRHSSLQNIQGAQIGLQNSVQLAVFYAINVIKQIGYDDFFTSLFTGIENLKFKSSNDRIKAFNDLWDSIENTITWQEITHKQANELMQHFSEANKKRESAIDNYLKFIRPEIFNALHNKEIENTIVGDYLSKAKKINDTHFNSKRYNYPLETQKNLVEPILILDNEFKANISLVYTSYMYLQKASAGFYEMEAILNNCKEMYLQQAELFATYSETIKTSKNLLLR